MKTKNERKTCVSMSICKTAKEIGERIAEIENEYAHVLTGSIATVTINAPRALQQVMYESELAALHWARGTVFTSKLKGVDK